ncbi:hypothetical protein ARC20_05215 [Stenotrophomonas panacihumi]|uniref:Autotransporter domain-containing protein n=1 Tax=Stenotrophomonas panacihumi TaxID=676599 RepID=A0A0R0AXB2_9GAMM|nr:YadA-like family protein [Stenotrophomonas panacihumi]KRG46398.1 hypothetical protein ARC20_05215 [Stenotrophomonas panacihumi]
MYSSSGVPQGEDSIALGGYLDVWQRATFWGGVDMQNTVITNLARGAADTDAVNVGQLRVVTNALGGGATINADGSVTGPTYSVGGTNYTNVGAALGSLNTAVNGGGGVKYFRVNSTYLDASAPGQDSVAIGPAAVSSGRYSVAMGGSAQAASESAVALGDTAIVSATAPNGVAIGLETTAGAAGAVAMGSGATAGQAGAVALGAGATSAAAVATAGVTIADTAYTFAGTAPASTVSIGAAGSERTLTNLAAGRLATTSTDAVNGSQLNATNLEVGALDDRVDAFGTGVASALGGGAGYDATTGALTAPSYSVGGTAVNNVGAAVTNLDGRTTSNTTAISNLGDAINSGATGLVRQDATTRQLSVGAATDGTRVDLTGTAGTRVLAGVTAGTVSASSTEAINGSQLFATNQTVGTVSTQVAATDDKVDALGSGTATALGGGSAYDAATGALTAPSYSVDGTTVNSVGAAVSNLDGRTTSNTTAITNLGDAINSGATGLVRQDATTRQLSVGAATDGTRVDLTGTAGTRVLAGVTAGTVSASSTEAINGSQLFAGNSSIASALGGGATVNPDGTVAAPTYQVGGSTYTSVGGALVGLDARIDTVVAGATKYFHVTSSLADSVASGADSVAVGPLASASAADTMALGRGATAGQAGAVALGAASVTAAAVATTGTTIAGTAYTFAGTTPASTVSIGAVGSERTLTNLAAGRLSTTSTDAINGSQLFATNQAVGTLGTQLGAADDKVDALGGAAATSLGGGSAYNPATGTLTAPSYSVGGGTVNDVGAAVTNLDARTTSNTTAIGNLDDAINNGSIGLVRQDATTRQLSVGAATDGTRVDLTGTAGSRVLVGLGAGTVSASSTEAINGSQLFAGNSSIATALGGGAAINPDGTLAAPTYQVGGTLYRSVGDAVGGIDTVLGAITGGAGVKYFRVNSTAADAAATGANSVAGGPEAKAEGVSSTALGQGAAALSNDTVAVGHGAVAGVPGGNSGETAVGANAQATADNAAAFGAGATASQIGAVALGAGSQTTAAVATPSGVVAGTVYAYAGATPASTVSLGAVGAERTLTNVAAGRVSASSTDAINGSQLFATHQAVEATAAQAGAVGGKVDALGGAVAQGLGGGAIYDAATGGMSAPTYHVNGTDYDNVGDALSHLALAGVQPFYFHANSLRDDSQAQGEDSIAIGPEAYAEGTGAVALGLGANALQDGSVALGSGAVTEVAVGTASTTIAGTAYTFAGATPASTVSIGAAGSERTLTNVAAGRIGASSTDAINGSQLYATNQSVDSLASVVGAISTGAGIKYFRANSTGADASATGTDSVAVGPTATASASNSVALGSAASASHDNSIALGAGSQTTTGAQSGYDGAYVGSSQSVGELALGGRTVSGVAAGSLGTDAVNVSQLTAGVNSAIEVANAYTETRLSQIVVQPGGDSAMFRVAAPTTRAATVAGTDAVAGGSGAIATGAQSVALGNDAAASGAASMALGHNAQANGDNSVAIGAGSVASVANTVSVGSAGNERTVSNVAAGVQATDAVNVSQLRQTQAGTAQYDTTAAGGTDYASLSLGGPGGATTTRVHNVSAGVAPTDAVNVQQLEGGLAQARQYTDQRLQAINGDMWTMRREMRGGTASAMAMAGMPQASEAGRNMVAVGVGGFQGEVGMAVGMSRVSESGRYLMQAQMSGNTTRDFGFSVGAGLQW